jgi:hypothetical protein
VSYIGRAGIQPHLETPATGVPMAERALAITAAQQPRDDPASLWGYYEANANNTLGFLLWKLDRLEEAERVMARGAARLEELVEGNPTNLSIKRTAAGALTNLATVEMERGRVLAAARHYQKALGYWKEPFSRNPREPVPVDLGVLGIGPPPHTIDREPAGADDHR